MMRLRGVARVSGEPRAGKKRCAGMRNEDYTMELFLAVGLAGQS